MKLKLTTFLKITLGLSLCGGGFFLNVKQSTKETLHLSASASSYWSSINNNESADNLFNKLSSKINSNTVSLGYKGLWSAYQETDFVPNTKKIWDMYGGFQFTYQTGGKNYSKEGDCYNREHSVPKSWWGSTEDERFCDIIHLVPTDGEVNNRRSNWAFGEVDTVTYSYSFPSRQDGYGNTIQTAGASKLGIAKSINGVAYPGGKSTVFEPDDQYKGDFARIYYYFATRYGPKGKIATQGDGARMFSDDPNDFYMTPYGKALMNKWHVQDPVSQKELDRNDGVEATQKNRNPYVDHPEWADKIFGSNYAYVHGGGTVNNDPSLSIVATNKSLKVGESTTLTAYLQNITGTIQWYIEDSSNGAISLSSTTGSSITVNGLVEGTSKVWAHIGSVSDSVNITVTSSGSTNNNDDDDGTIKFGSGNVQINAASISDFDSLGKTWTIITKDTASYTQNAKYSQVGSSGDPATSITFSMNLGEAKKITDFSIDLGGFNGTAGTVTLKVDSSTVGTGKLSASSDVTVKANDTSKTGSVLTVSITGISKGVKVYGISYSFESTSSEIKTLESITLLTNSAKTVFNVDDAFTYSGLVVNANYSNGSTKVVDPTNVSSPDMSSAGTKNVTVSYTEGETTKSATYQITVNAGSSIPSYITATVEKTYFVGDEISGSDVLVEDNLGNVIDDFYFGDEGYQFTYDDAASGGEATEKVFTNTVSYDEMVCSLTVTVKRKERIVSVSDTITADDLEATGTSYKAFSNVKKTSDALYKGNSAKNGVCIQLNNKDDVGIVSTKSPGNIKSVTINVDHGEKYVDVYGRNTPYTASSDLYGDNKGTLIQSVKTSGVVTFNSDFMYVGIRAQNGAVYLESIVISYGESDSSKTLADYIMFEDTEAQCNSKFDQAKNIFEGLSTTERATFMTSVDYVISSARERLEAWAVYLGKTISIENGDYVIKNASVNRTFTEELNKDETAITLIFVICVVASLGSMLYLFKRKRLSK